MQPGATISGVMPQQLYQSELGVASGNQAASLNSFVKKGYPPELVQSSRNCEKRPSLEGEVKSAALVIQRDKGSKKRPPSRRKKGGTISGVVATHAYGATFKQMIANTNPNLSGGLYKTLKFVHRNVSIGSKKLFPKSRILTKSVDERSNKAQVESVGAEKRARNNFSPGKI